MITSPVASPCINVCQLDASEGMCVGCGRTTDEIGKWMVLDAAERNQIVGQLSVRLAQIHDGPPEK